MNTNGMENVSTPTGLNVLLTPTRPPAWANSFRASGAGDVVAVISHRFQTCHLGG
jgi:hypothetical protein